MERRSIFRKDKAKKDAEYQAKLDSEKVILVRKEITIIETDWWAVSDRTMSYGEKL